jgi:hypothetical protein
MTEPMADGSPPVAAMPSISSTENRVQHAEVIGLGLAPALPGHNGAANVSPVASTKHNSGWNPKPPRRSPRCRPCSPSGSPAASCRCRGSLRSRCWSRSSGAAPWRGRWPSPPRDHRAHRGADALESAVGARGRRHRPEQPLLGPQVLDVGTRVAAPPPASASRRTSTLTRSCSCSRWPARGIRAERASPSPSRTANAPRRVARHGPPHPRRPRQP